MPVNDYLGFAVGVGANVQDQPTYVSNPAVNLGASAGTALSALNNKTLRQATVPASAIAQFIVDTLAIDMHDDGSVSNFETQFIAAIRSVGTVMWSANSPPPDYNLRQGASVTISFSNLATIPLSIAVAANAIYRILLVVWASNSTRQNWNLLANNALYSNSFYSYNIELTDRVTTALGTTSTPPTLTAIPTGNLVNFSGQIGGVTHATYGTAGGIDNLGANSFIFDTFAGPNNSQNGVGPMMLELVVSTITTAKFIKGNSMVKGAPAIQGSVWSDTTTPWTSLGSLTCPYATQNTGTVQVQRIN